MLTGLVVGKFSPLHAGHQALIQFAQERCDRLVILSYSKPELPGCPAALRAEWLEALFPDTVRMVLDDDRVAAFASQMGQHARPVPDNDAPDDDQRAFVGWVCDALLGLAVDRVFTSEEYGAGFAAALARDLGRPVEHLSFDPARIHVPISGTRLRADAALHARFLPEPVRRSLVGRVAPMGGESSGYPTLAAPLGPLFRDTLGPEDARKLWDDRGGELP